MTRSFPNRPMRAAAALGALALAAAAHGPALSQDAETPGDVSTQQSAEDAEPMTEGEQRLAKLLEGRVAGEPQNCIQSLPTQRFTTIDGTAYVFGRGNTIYVQRTTRPDQIDDRDTLVMRRFGASTQVCRQDIATTVDPLSRIFTGAVFFEDFIPYTRVDDEEG